MKENSKRVFVETVLFVLAIGSAYAATTIMKCITDKEVTLTITYWYVLYAVGVVLCLITVAFAAILTWIWLTKRLPGEMAVEQAVEQAKYEAQSELLQECADGAKIARNLRERIFFKFHPGDEAYDLMEYLESETIDELEQLEQDLNDQEEELRQSILERTISEKQLSKDQIAEAKTFLESLTTAELKQLEKEIFNDETPEVETSKFAKKIAKAMDCLSDMDEFLVDCHSNAEECLANCRSNAEEFLKELSA